MGDLVRATTRDVLAPYVVPGSQLDQIVSGWLLRCKSPLTESAYRRDIALWFSFCAQTGLDVYAADSDHVSAFMRVCEQTTTPQGTLPLASTVARRVAVVSSFYRHCRRRKAVTENPAEDTDRPEVDYDNSTTTGMTADEAQRLIQAAEQFVNTAKTNRVRVAAERDAAVVAVMLCTGGRVSEVTAAQMEHLGYDQGHRVLWVKRKGGKRQSVALGESARVIDRHVANEGRITGLIFQTRNVRPVDRSHVFRVIRKAALAAHLPCAAKLTAHSLRHTFATLAFNSGADISEVQDAMGHADPRTTRRYDRARNRIDRSPVHAVSRSLLGGGPIQP